MGIHDRFRLFQMELVVLVHIFFVSMNSYHIRQKHIVRSQRHDLAYLAFDVHGTLADHRRLHHGCRDCCKLHLFKFIHIPSTSDTAVVLAQMMVPSQLTLIPRFIMFMQLGWMNTHLSLIVPKIIAVSSTFMLRQSFLSTPDELREAARIDGAGEYRAFAQVMLPLVKPTIAATATVQFLDAWNSYLDPLVFISNWKKWTIPLALNQFVGTEVTQYNLTMAACCMAVVPVFIVFLFGQKFFLKGLSVGAVKG